MGKTFANGLYEPFYEHDACGIGFIANIKGKKSFQIVQSALEILVNLDHRGARGCEENTGDGAGLLAQIPHKFFKKIFPNLPQEGDYAVAQIFFPGDEEKIRVLESKFEEIVEEEGLKLIFWRRLETDNSTLGNVAKLKEPVVKQAFIKRSDLIKRGIDFERKLYLIRKRAEKEIKYADEDNLLFYICSLSSRTIVYKGMLTPQQVPEYYKDLRDPDFESAIAVVHSRFSTNTFPSWERAHPYRYIIHNGEINTLRGNINWMKAREKLFASKVFPEITKCLPVINEDGSDSQMFDNCLEMLYLTGRSLPHAVMMMIPEPWQNHESMDEKKRAFYKYHSCLMEPWDGPASIVFTDGLIVGAVLDRNGLRPSRYYVMDDDTIVLSSEVGVCDIDPEKIVLKDRLKPGRMLLVDTVEGRIISDEELKKSISEEKPYSSWLDKYMIALDDLVIKNTSLSQSNSNLSLTQLQLAFGYTYEDIKKIIEPMALQGVEPVGSMGYDSPLAVLSNQEQLLYNYFKQLFAQVTNPPLDGIREEIITASEMLLGSEGNLIEPRPEDCRRLLLKNPILTNTDMLMIKSLDHENLKSETVSILFNRDSDLKTSLDNLFEVVDVLIGKGVNVIVLSDKGASFDFVPIPALLALSGLNHHLIKKGTRTKVSIVLESAEPREVHHFACLIGYGASAINPYLVFDTLKDMCERSLLEIEYDLAVKNYVKAALKGVMKVASKMGISTLQSYMGAQIFECVGIGKEVIDKYFTGTPSRIGGINLDIIKQETLLRYNKAFLPNNQILPPGGIYQYRDDGEYHAYRPETIYLLQRAVIEGDYKKFKAFTASLHEGCGAIQNLRGLFRFKKQNNSIPIDEVESVESIVKRFKTGAMSYGSISKEAHETLAIAMNRIGGKSNTGEGGEDPSRYIPDENGDSRNSAIKQVASARFGVDSLYLANASEIQIKMAQGAKPGEGGQLPGQKVYPWVAKTRYSTPGVGLISPPPHHDIYSIEDLAELIHDLKNANRKARINVKLVSEVGVGTIAAGVSKGKADVVLISGYDGGTGASPRSSIRHAGLPWELGLSETHQTLVLNNLRDRITVEVDGKLMSGRDIAIAAMLGAEEFGFATLPLVALGCVMMRVCNLDTCPVGIATQNPELRKYFKGKPEYVINLMYFLATELREIMAQMGFRTVNEMVGRTDCLEVIETDHWKAKTLCLDPILAKPPVGPLVGRYCTKRQDHSIEKSLDYRILLDRCKRAIENKEPVEISLPIKNTNRVVGTILGSEITSRYGLNGLPPDTIKINFVGSAGQSFGAFLPKGITLVLEGDSNDYIAKGLSGGKIIVYPPKNSKFVAHENIIIGNVAFYGATSGEGYIRGVAGERFCVRNSGANVVVEGVGDHGCEYMTGGIVICLGKTGRNFAAGMTGGIAYVYDIDESFKAKININTVYVESIKDLSEEEKVRSMIEKHELYTDSSLARQILSNWEQNKKRFVKIIPKDYKRMLLAIEKAYNAGFSGDEALMEAFYENIKDMSRISGN
ncbi:glutamate synthase (NADH) large subunit [Thermodesulfobium acidiphilum]|uniref:Glutamate synthase [NADPH] large chain n=1 Tax=Thermodesulfobium acidiphilum TaxID=1794699 RepID=A0A2R4VYE9_THEAF|nr:glutamate synthase large subunit [Thermodesulfobium acidiphilum]AWB09490.1 glutamate synthase (NADH) large subunit [Thermodesulfobium acidiphilum]